MQERPAAYSAGWVAGRAEDYDREYCVDLVQLHGIKHGPHHVDFFYDTQSPGNVKAKERYDANRFSVARQLRYRHDETQRALDVALNARQNSDRQDARIEHDKALARVMTAMLKALRRADSDRTLCS